MASLTRMRRSSSTPNGPHPDPLSSLDLQSGGSSHSYVRTGTRVAPDCNWSGGSDGALHLRHRSAIDDDRLAGDELRSVRAQELDNAGDVFAAAESPRRSAAHDLIFLQ